jgi:DNA-binding CsgD family transcriptional regulator
LLAAAERLGDSDLIWRAMANLGLDAEDAQEASSSGVLRLDPAVEFRHPLVRSAVYRSASAGDRARVHVALATMLSDPRDADRRAIHLAAAAEDPDESVARDLVQSADRARARGGYNAEAILLARAAELTAEDAERASRLLAASSAALRAGRSSRAAVFLERAKPMLTDPQLQAIAERIDGNLHLTRGQMGVVPSILCAAAVALQPFDIEEARDTMLEAMEAARIALQLAAPTTLQEVADAALSRPRADDSEDSIADLLLDAYATDAADGFVEAVPIFKRALTMLCDGDLHPDAIIRWGLLGNWTAGHILDDRRLRQFLLRVEQQARVRGALVALEVTLNTRAQLEIYAGRFESAEAFHTEELSIASAIAGGSWNFLTVELQAWRGDEATRRVVADLSGLFESLGAGVVIVNAHACLTRLEIGYARFKEAYAAALVACDPALPVGGDWRVLPDLVEAAARTGRSDNASSALREFERRAIACDTPWATGLLERSRALVAEPSAAEAHYRAAIAALETTSIKTDLARAHLLYGEWLNERNRGVDARAQLRIAHDMFATMGAQAFASRARTALGSVGTVPHVRLQSAGEVLTAEEARIAQLAATGATNSEIAAQVFVSASTVDYHLRKVFKKLSITSRRQLASSLPSAVP